MMSYQPYNDAYYRQMQMQQGQPGAYPYENEQMGQFGDWDNQSYPVCYCLPINWTEPNGRAEDAYPFDAPGNAPIRRQQEEPEKAQQLQREIRDDRQEARNQAISPRNNCTHTRMIPCYPPYRRVCYCCCQCVCCRYMRCPCRSCR